MQSGKLKNRLLRHPQLDWVSSVNICMRMLEYVLQTTPLCPETDYVYIFEEGSI